MSHEAKTFLTVVGVIIFLMIWPFIPFLIFFAFVP